MKVLKYTMIPFTNSAPAMKIISFLLAIGISFSCSNSTVNNSSSTIECISTRASSVWQNPSSSHPTEWVVVWAKNECDRTVKYEINITKKDTGVSVSRMTLRLEAHKEKKIVPYRRIAGDPTSYDYTIVSQSYK